MATNIKIEEKASELGVSLTWLGNNEGVAYAPKGYVFCGTGTHAVAFVHSDPYARRGKRSEALAGLAADLSCGLALCRTAGCEVCSEE